MAFSPGWCYQPGLKGPSLYISNDGSVHLRSRLRRPAPPGRAIRRRRARLYRAAVVVYPARPRHSPSPHRAPHPVSAAAPNPTLRRRRFSRAHRTLRRTLDLLLSIDHVF